METIAALEACLIHLVDHGVLSAEDWPDSKYTPEDLGLDLTPKAKPLVRWEIDCKAHAARSANKRGGTLPIELCGFSSL